MASKAEKDRGKQIEDKCQALLTEMLRDEDNKYCVDCDAKGPRWASWNLGIFLCIRCAGIHRNLGVHISKVKSVNLDTWTPEQVVSLQQMGNSRARAVYEANIPDNFRRPQSDSALEAFVRAKYEHKKYIAKEWVPTPIPNVKQNWDKELDEEAERQKKRKKETKATQQQARAKAAAESSTPQMLPKPKSSTSPRPMRSSPGVDARRTPKAAATVDLFFDAPASTAAPGQASSNGEDIFSGFLSAPPAPAVPPPSATPVAPADDGGRGRSAEEDSFFNQPAPSSNEKRQLTKDSILALYGAAQSAPAQPPQQGNSMFGVPGGVYTQPQGGFPPQQQPPAGMGFGMSNGMMGQPQGGIPNGMMGQPQGGIPNGMMGQPQGGIPNGMMGQPQGGIPNGMMGQQPTSSLFNVGVPQQGGNASMGMALNPFFNIGANPMANTMANNMANPMANMGQGFSQMSQEHVVLQNPNQDLMSDSFSVLAAKHLYADPKLPQQLGRMNLGPQMKLPTQMYPGQPGGMQMSAANPAPAMSAFPPSNNPGHTLATNLWQ